MLNAIYETIVKSQLRNLKCPNIIFIFFVCPSFHLLKDKATENILNWRWQTCCTFSLFFFKQRIQKIANQIIFATNYFNAIKDKTKSAVASNTLPVDQMLCDIIFVINKFVSCLLSRIVQKCHCLFHLKNLLFYCKK